MTAFCSNYSFTSNIMRNGAMLIKQHSFLAIKRHMFWNLLQGQADRGQTAAAQRRECRRPSADPSGELFSVAMIVKFRQN